MQTDINHAGLEQVGLIIKNMRGIDIAARKSDCILRRISLRMRVTNCSDIDNYCALLRQSEQELDLLLKLLTIHVSQFYRNPSLFEKLRSEVLPNIFDRLKQRSAKVFHICSLGCAKGEEPYSLALLLKDSFSNELKQTSVQIAAVDIDEQTLAAARLAEFEGERLKSLPDHLKQRYFRSGPSGFSLDSEIKDMVSFYQNDINGNIHLPASDLLLCRNTLIYFNRGAQEAILNRIADMLAPEGILVLGKSETIVGETRNRFSPVCRVERIYRKLA
jgi:chemotaxis protein methyltransferase CheR